jgi:hypothetical protein
MKAAMILRLPFHLVMGRYPEAYFSKMAGYPFVKVVLTVDEK